MAADFLDRYSRGTTICHRLDPRLKIVMTVAVIVAALVTPVAHWPVHGCLACFIFVMLSLAEIPLSYLGRRLMLVAPMLALSALSAPLSRGFSGGGEVASAIVIRGYVAFLAALWLVNTTPFERLLTACRQLGLPRLPAAMLSFMYRYVFVLFDELARMRTAQRARTFGRRGAWARWMSSVHLVGMLLIRSLDRAERIHGAMCARGWKGDVRTLE